MSRSIFVTVSVAVILFAGVSMASADDKGNKKQHDEIQNALSTHDGNQTSQHDALSQQLTDVQTAIGNISTNGVGRCDVPPVWGAAITTGRFVSVFGGAAYCDQETGLVWEQSPGETDGVPGITDADKTQWSSATFDCLNKNVGGRRGWRLPSVVELASLVDPANSNPALPTGHPFTNIQSTFYWSASALAGFPTDAWGVFFDGGFVVTREKAREFFVWCVRGEMNADQY